MKKSFDLLAPVYDQLAKIVFGNSIQMAQCANLGVIKEHDNILILGGGTGWILPKILQMAPNVRITYIESSGKMLEQAKASVQKKQLRQIKFIQKPVQEVVTTQNYDIVFTGFFLDMFCDLEVNNIIHRLNKQLKHGGRWIFTDFRNSSRIFHKTLLKIMYMFFGLICGIKARKLANIKLSFYQNGLLKKNTHYYYNGMIESVVYKKHL